MSESASLLVKSRAERSGVEGSQVARGGDWADVAQLVEHSLGKGEVTSSILVIGSMGLTDS